MAKAKKASKKKSRKKYDAKRNIPLIGGYPGPHNALLDDRQAYSTSRSPFGEVSTVSSYLFVIPPYPYNPDNLIAKKGLRIYTDMMHDEQVKAAMLAKHMSVISAGWEIEPADYEDQDKNTGGSDNEQAKRVGDFVTNCLEKIPGSLDSKLLEMLTATIYGYSVAEKVYEPVLDGEWAGKIALTDLKFRHPLGLDFRSDAFGNLLPNGMMQAGRYMMADKFLIYTYRKKFSNYYGDSDLRDAYRAWWAKDNIIKFMCMALERFGQPTWVFTQEGAMPVDSRAQLLQFMTYLQSNSGIILPKSITAKPETPNVQRDLFIGVLEYLDELIRVGLLMPGLIGFGTSRGGAGHGAGGSYARSQTEFDAFVTIMEFLRKDVEVNINEQVIPDLVDFNFEITDGKYPKFKFSSVTAEQTASQFDAYLKAMSVGAFTKTREDENKLRDLMEFGALPDDVQMNPGTAGKGGAGGAVGALPESPSLNQEPGLFSHLDREREDLLQEITSETQAARRYIRDFLEENEDNA